MEIKITINEPVPQETEIIGLKEALTYVLEIHKLTVGRIDIQDADQSVQDRYKHLVKTHGERADYVAGFRDCMLLANAEIERLTINMNAFGLGMKREKERADTARAEAIKEVFSEIENRIGIGNDILDFWDIFDELKKEMGCGE